ncbi:molybdopterin-binding protein, partial [Streptococcus agalactiae]|nr:molybdopterin-binding protein [Streptococcus agalactiae]
MVARIAAAGHVLADRAILRDDADAIVAQLDRWIDDPSIDCVVTTGGTGVTGRDVTPEAVERVADKMIPGFGELFRWLSYAKIGTSTIQSRA